jgi:hypothetical protein
LTLKGANRHTAERVERTVSAREDRAQLRAAREELGKTLPLKGGAALLAAPRRVGFPGAISIPQPARRINSVRESLMNTRTIALVIAFASLVSPPFASAQISLPVPGNIEVPAGFQPFLVAGAEGTQNYVCLPSASGHKWTFFGPQATLIIGDYQVMTHFLSPNPDESGAARATWQHSVDTSTIWAAAIESSTDPDFVAQGAIPWLLLKVMGDEPGHIGGTTLSGAAYIQRVNTAGGIAPATGCKNAKDIGKKALVPYTAEYAFFR